jgi:hypothetical protein
LEKASFLFVDEKDRWFESILFDFICFFFCVIFVSVHLVFNPFGGFFVHAPSPIATLKYEKLEENSEHVAIVEDQYRIEKEFEEEGEESMGKREQEREEKRMFSKMQKIGGIFVRFDKMLRKPVKAVDESKWGNGRTVFLDRELTSGRTRMYVCVFCILCVLCSLFF